MEAQLLYHFTPPDKLPPHSYTILPPLAAQLLNHFTPSEQITPLTLKQFYPPWQHDFYLILPPRDKLPPHSYTVLPPLAAQLLPHLTPSGGITASFLHHFTPPPPRQPNSYLILRALDKLPPHSYTILPPLEA